MLNSDVGKIKLNGIRHPCLELQEDMSYIPNDVEFDKGKFLKHKFCIIVLNLLMVISQI